MRIRHRILVYILIAAIACGPNGCAVGPGAEGTKEESGEKVVVEAYLFDAKLRRKGKPTSFRLEMYSADTLLGLAGRGYVGKGILKGVLTRDRLKCFFPTTNEYIDEPLDSVLSSLPCAASAPSLDILSLFTSLPEEVAGYSQYKVDTNHTDRRRRYILSAIRCEWEIDLTYDVRGDRWRIREFVYRDGDRVSLTVVRREYRRQARVRLSRLEFQLPPGAVRVRP